MADYLKYECRSAAALVSQLHIKKLIPFWLENEEVRLETKIVSLISFFTARIDVFEVLDMIFFFNYTLL